ncbi:hypothetical protein A2419_01035 [Candidatus Adlerbacteria bacterium RIFOXYC1_FULL_48_26]|uniref:Cupin 2 conserved barrel domain-containing protein n=1 Tax=Candidatus Adlerbacteria bacterium RIFOXYC1_FULL_48_26 TaxID=1797247 RepID=A0A1F4Y4P2_9BACT|nr:MAG: hypothetical protein A2419_01035 [Candidatus Adlerbacteria bacterium RIFOXYC1_FULL_48_26]OGC94217.1 MAG: hypothetical protein A2389_03165 [Candidatus Adlerbacteria bacterium RIFOXYB1_FULL_48_10]
MAIVPTTQGKLGVVSAYSATAVAAEHRGWPLGQFVTDINGTPLTEAFEVKAGTLKVGEVRDEWSSGEGDAFMLVLSGACETTFDLEGNDDPANFHTVVSRAGDALFWNNAVPHKRRTLEETQYVFVRRLKK